MKGALLVLLLLFGCLFHAPKAQAQTITICTIDPVPAGYVILQQITKAGCPANAGYQLSLPSQGLWVCSNSPIPSPYTIVEISSTIYPECGTIRKDKINKAAEGAWVCGNSPIPSPYVVTDIIGSVCLTGIQQYQIRAAGSIYDACAISTIPAPWVITRINTTSHCNGQKAYSLAKVTYNGFNMCWNTPIGNIPNGYVVTSQFNSGDCAPGTVYVLMQAYPNIEICAVSPVPAGWYKSSQAPNSGQCIPVSPRWYINH